VAKTRVLTPRAGAAQLCVHRMDIDDLEALERLTAALASVGIKFG